MNINGFCVYPPKTGIYDGNKKKLNEQTQIDTAYVQENISVPKISPELLSAYNGINLNINKNSVSQKITSQLEENASKLSGEFEGHIKEATSQIEKEFGDLQTKEKITGRAKSEYSILKKLEKKFIDNKLKTTDIDESREAIGDAYGTRIQMKSLTKEQAKQVIEKYNISYDEFKAYVSNNKSNLSDEKIEKLEAVKTDILEKLKEKQSQEVVDRLADSIKSGKIVISELNNYGDELSAYFTSKQLNQIADAYYEKTGKALTLVTHQNLNNNSVGAKIDENNTEAYKINLNNSKAVKKSGYTSAQMNILHTFKDGKQGMGEFQIRGVKVNDLADVEHIPYDIRQGKITEEDIQNVDKCKKYKDIYNIIDNMNDETYNKYNKFLYDTYNAMRLQELGIESKTPDIHNVFEYGEIPQEAFKMLSIDGLVEISKKK